MPLPPTSWIVIPRPNPQARIRLFCFPYAGGGTAVYNAWARQLPDWVELCSIRLPGRESRLGERPFSQLDLLLSDLIVNLTPSLGQPFAFFGHSMGAMIAFELTRRLRAAQQPLPQNLLLSGFRAPHLPDLRPPLHHLPDADFLAGIRNLGGTPSAVFDYPELIELMLPALRADFTLVETYRYEAERPLAIPITAFAADADTIAPVARMTPWQTQTTAPFTLHTFSGDHFYFQPQPEPLLTKLLETLRDG